MSRPVASWKRMRFQIELRTTLTRTGLAVISGMAGSTLAAARGETRGAGRSLGETRNGDAPIGYGRNVV